MQQSHPASPVSAPRFLPNWAAVTAGGALLLTVVDALLLQRTKSYFTGGFLTVDYLTGPAETAAFVVLSFLADASVVGVIAAFVIWILTRFRFRARTAAVAALLAAIAPLLVADVVAYELASYLGDLIDLSLSMELAGGSIGEIIAVTSSHLITPALLLVAGGGAAGGLVWLTTRYSADKRPILLSRRQLWIPVVTFMFALTAAIVASTRSDTLENGLLRKPSGKLLAVAADVLTDVDRDGYGIVGRMSDPDLFDASVFPYGLDVPGNGIDEDGVGGDLPAGTSPYAELPPVSEPWVRRPDVVLVVLESFRADLLGATHEGKLITPVMNALAARGVFSNRAYSHNGYTAPSRYHLLSGSLVAGRDGRTLIDDFNANGYFTAYFSGQDESFSGPESQVGFERADVWYDARQDRNRRYSTFTTAGSLAVPFTVVQERVGEFLREGRGGSEPLFLYVNFHDTHFPYSHNQIQTIVSPARLQRSSIQPQNRDALWATYVNTAANVDRAVGELLDQVRNVRGRQPAIIVTADHGESLFDENFLGHGYALNDVQTRIPLIAANLPIVIEEPFAGRDLRDAIGAALRVPADGASEPRVEAVHGREVFQYLGNLHRPRQIAFLQNDRRIIYDFRSQRVQIGEGVWQQPSALPVADRAEFLRLVQEWERMMLARALHLRNGR
jgi:hypothetical protein